MRNQNNRTRAAAAAMACICAIILLALPFALSNEPADDQWLAQQSGIVSNATGQTQEPVGQDLSANEAATGEATQDEADAAASAATATDTEYEPGVVLVDFAADVTEEQALQAFAANEQLAGITVRDRSQFCTALSLPETLSVEQAVELLPETGLVQVAEPNYYLQVADGGSYEAGTASFTSGGAGIDADTGIGADIINSNHDQLDLQEITAPNDTLYGEQWALPSVKALEAWNTVQALSPSSANPVVIAVADNGFDLNNPDFNIVNPNNPKDMSNDVVYPYIAALHRDASYSGVAFPDSSASNADHGTHVAGIIAAHANNSEGIAGATYNNCKLMPIRLSDSSGSMSVLYLSYALEHVIDLKKNQNVNVRVINMSVGINSRARGDVIQKAIDETVEEGIVVVAAACNRDSTDFPVVPCAAYPSDYDNVVSVINLTDINPGSSDGVKRDDSSNYNTDGQMAKDIAAPGTNIASTSFQAYSFRGYSWYRQKSGTSMASPLVAGVLGLMFTADPSLTTEEATSKLYSSARDLTRSLDTATGWDRETGYGEVDAASAVASTTPYTSGATVMGVGMDNAFTVKEGGSAATGYTWSTSNTSVATVDASGKVTAVGPGEVIVKAANGSSVAQQTIKVYGISGTDSLPVGLGADYGISPTSSDGWTWSVTALDGSATSYASIDSATGALTTIAAAGFTSPQKVLVKAVSSNYPYITAQKEVSITSNEITEANTNVTFGSIVYNGTYQQPIPTVTEGSTTLEYNKHFTVEWRNNLNAGTGTATITAKAPLTGSITKNFTIAKAPLSAANIQLSATSFTFASNSKKQAPTLVAVYDIGVNYRQQYSLGYFSYSAPPIALGTGTATITASATCKNFTGTATRTFTVNASWQPMYRLYNPYSGEHFYTANASERNHLIQVGWRNENVGWYAPTTGDNVYRLYNPNAGDHHYTLSSDERRYLLSVGWRDEGVGWKSGGTTPLYREYNPYAVAGAHNYTTSLSEHNYLCRIGWRNENIAWYGR